MPRRKREKKTRKPAMLVRLAWRYGWKPGKVMREVLEWIEVLAVAGVLAVLIMTFITVRMTVPSGSMLPTIQRGDSFFVDRVTYYFREPKPGDIIVFWHTDAVFLRKAEEGSVAEAAGVPSGEELLYLNTRPIYSTDQINTELATWPEGTRLVLTVGPRLDPQQIYLGTKTAGVTSLNDLGVVTRDKRVRYVKRLIAIGGQTVQIRDGDIFVDGVELTDPEFDREYISSGNALLYGVEPTLVPEGHYFALGDNSANSEDSRYWGFVDEKDFIGEPYLRVLPLGRFGWMNF